MTPPKIFTRMPFTLGIAQNDLERGGDLPLPRAAADVEEVRWAAAEMLDDVHGGHAARPAPLHLCGGDAAVQLDVMGGKILGSLDLEGRFLVQIAHLQ